MLASALGGMTAIPQWFVWRLTPDPAKPIKYIKVPVHPDGRIHYFEGRLTGMDAQQPSNWTSFEVAQQQLMQHLGRLDGFNYALGFMLSQDCGYWFLDVDSCVTPQGLSTWAQNFYAALPGVFFEYSSSMTGVHFIGRGCPPPGHRTRPTQQWKQANPTDDLEFYTSGRGICFGINGQAWGSADMHLPQQAQWLVDNIFIPDVPVNASELGHGPRADWNGPTDDMELLRRAMMSTGAKAMFGGGATFADLWTCNIPVLAKFYPDTDRADGLPYGGTEVDFALASHLAFWTGCDVARIERLMRQSQLVRPKWDEHKTYLVELTIRRACERTSNVLQDAVKVQKLDVVTTLEARRGRDEYLDAIRSCDTDTELRNDVIPLIAQDAGLDPIDRDFLASAIKKRFHEWSFPTTLNECKNMVRMQRVDSGVEIGAPAFANNHCYVLATDCFFDLTTGVSQTRSGFNAQYERMMPQKPNGDREDAAKWCLQRWNTSTVHDTMYLPGHDPMFQHEGRWYANMYSPSTVPEIALGYTQRGIEAIERFLKHMQALCGSRQDVYTNLIDWMAWCAQNPGKKCRYAPLIKGMQGDGKSLIINVMMAVMGMANVGSVNSALLTADFGDWQEGTCVTAFEELMLTGSKRYSVANRIKEPITNNFLTINRKGRPSGCSIINVTNYIAFTNFVDAVPLEDTDRRYWVIFSPFTCLAKLAGALGLNEQQLGGHFDFIFDSLKDERRGEWRKFFLEYQVSAAFKPNGTAPYTSEKKEMQLGGEDALDAVARQCIESGAVGVGLNVLSSSALTAAMRAICIQDGLDMPKTSAVNHMLARMGFSPAGVMKWDGKSHRVWWRRGEVKDASSETLRNLLELTKIQQIG